MTRPAAHAGLEAQLADLLTRVARMEDRYRAYEDAARTPPQLTDTPSAARHDTPPVIRWPTREPFAGGVPHPLAAPDPADVLGSLADVVWSVCPAGERVLYLGGGVGPLFGRPPQAFRDRPGLWLDAVPADDRGRLREAFRRLPEAGAFAVEHRIDRPAGGPRWALARGRLVRDAAGRPLRVDGVTTDITDRAGTGHALAGILEGVGPATGAAFLAALVRHLAATADVHAAVVAEPDPLDPARGRVAAGWVGGRACDPFPFAAGGSFVADLFAGNRSVVPSAARDRHPGDGLLARLRAESAAAEPLVNAAGTLVGFLAAVDDRPARGGVNLPRLLRALAPRAAAEMPVMPSPPAAEAGESANRVRGGARRPGGQNPSPPTPLPQGERGANPARDLEALLAAAEDRLRATDEQLRQARKLEAVGRLVGGVAHDFNNLLTVICGYADVISARLPPGDPLRDPAEQIAATGRTAASVTRQLLGFARPSPSDPRPVDLTAAVRGLDRLLRRLAGDAVPLTVSVAPRVSPVYADPAHVEQVLLNLVANARDAVTATPAGAGGVVVRTADAVVEAGRPGWPADRPAGGYVVLTVSDTGAGMADDVRAKAFDPFFTTKGAGTGLGLATVRDVVRAAGGHVELESAPGWGTTARVYWPRADGPTPAPAAEPPPADVRGRGETVLVVEDRDDVRGLARTALEGAGYRVLDAADGAAAEERLRLYAGPVHLLVADVDLPGVSGPAVVARLRAGRPGLKVLYISGHLPPDPPPAGDRAGAFLAKPYSPHRLLEAVRSALD